MRINNVDGGQSIRIVGLHGRDDTAARSASVQANIAPILDHHEFAVCAGQNTYFSARGGESIDGGLDRREVSVALNSITDTIRAATSNASEGVEGLAAVADL